MLHDFRGHDEIESTLRKGEKLRRSTTPGRRETFKCGEAKVKGNKQTFPCLTQQLRDTTVPASHIEKGTAILRNRGNRVGGPVLFFRAQLRIGILPPVFVEALLEFG
jgi:hypothetical protein